MSARASGRAIWSCSTKSPKAPPTAATALPSPSSPGCRRSVAGPREIGARQAGSRPRRDRRHCRRARRPAAVRQPASRKPPADPLAEALAAIDPDALTPARGARSALRAEAAGRGAADAAAAALRADRRPARDHRPPRAGRRGSPRCRRASFSARRSACFARRWRRPRAKSRAALRASRGAAGSSPHPTAFLADQIVRLAYDLVTTRIHPGPSHRSAGVAMVGLGGTGRGEMAPFSDLDLMFLVAERGSPWCEQVVETLLYMLWDLKLKVGQSVRTTDELIAAAKRRHDHPHGLARGALDLGRRGAVATRRCAASAGEVVAGSARDYVAAKLAERDAAPQTDGRQPLRRRAQRQGRQGRPARSPHALLDRPICVRRRAARRAGRQGPVHAPPNFAASNAPSASSGRCAATCTSPPGGPRSGSVSTCSARSPRRCATPTGRANRRSSASCNSIS